MTEIPPAARRLGVGGLCCLSAVGTMILAPPAEARPPQPPAATLFTARCLNTSLECMLSVLGFMLLAGPAAAQTAQQPVHGPGVQRMRRGAVRQHPHRAHPQTQASAPEAF